MIIGFNGKMGCGKSTAIRALVETINAQVALVKFAQPLYDMQEYMYRRIDTAYERPETFIKDRKLLQWIGTEWGRDTISKTLWVDIWKQAAGNVLYDDPLAVVVCDDVRFDNEAETIKRLGGFIVEITSKKADERIDTKAGIVQHSSESGIRRDLIDATLANDGTIEEFKRSIQEFYKQTKGKK